MKEKLILRESKNQVPSLSHSCPLLLPMCSRNLGLFQALNALESISLGQLWSDHGTLAAGESETNRQAQEQCGPLLGSDHGYRLQPPRPFPSQPSGERNARRASVTCPAWSFPANPVLTYSYFLFWMTRSLCCERLWVGVAAASLEMDAQQAMGWYSYLCASCYGAVPAAAPGTTVPLESQGLETSWEAASYQPHRALHASHRSVPGTRFYQPYNFADVL